MEKRFAMAALAAAVSTIVMTAGPAAAQAIPEGQSCGGLVCDLGLFGLGKKTAPPPAEAPPPAVTPEPKPEPVEAKTPIVRKKKRVAKAATPRTVAQKTVAPKSVTPKSVTPKSVPVAVTPQPAAAAAPVAPAPAPAPAPVAARAPAPAPDVESILSNPYATPRPPRPTFQSVDPSYGAQ